MKFFRNKRKVLVTVALIVLVFAIITGGCAIYVGDYYRADHQIVEAFAPMDMVSIEVLDDDTLVFEPENATKGFIIYPGGKVEYMAYQPLMAVVILILACMVHKKETVRLQSVMKNRYL